MEWEGLLRVLLALGFVLALLYGLAWGIRKSGLEKRLRAYSSSGGILAIEDTLFIDGKRKVVVIKRDEKRYAVLLGQTHDVLLESYTAVEKDIAASAEAQAVEVSVLKKSVAAQH